MVSALALLVLLGTGLCIDAAPTNAAPRHLHIPKRHRVDREGTHWLHDHRGEIQLPNRPHIEHINEVRPHMQLLTDNRTHVERHDVVQREADCPEPDPLQPTDQEDALEAGLGPRIM